MPRKLILDVDTGTDDAVAIMLAALHPDLDLIACTTVNGNAEVAYCTDNTLRVLDHVGRSDIPGGNHATLIKSIKDKLLPLGDDVAFICGHGPGSSIGQERMTNPFLTGAM